MDSNRQTRLKVLLDDYFLVIAVALIIIAAGGAWATYSTVLSPGSHIEQRSVASWNVSGGFSHSGTVVNDSLVFDEGDVRNDRMFYITNSTPTLNGTFWFQLGGSSGNATVSTEAYIVDFAYYEKENEESRNIQRRIWQDRRPISVDVAELRSGETKNMSFSVDADRLRDRKRTLHQKHKSLYQVADIRTQVFVMTEVTGRVDGYPVNRTFNYTLPINSTMDYFVVSPTQTPDEQIMIAPPTEVPNQPGTLIQAGSIAVLLASLLALFGLIYGRDDDWFDVSETKRTDIQHEKLKSEFEDWVSTGTIPETDRSTIEVESLEGLVDIAFDSNRRVVEDAATGVYVVRDDGVWYQYTPEWSEMDGTDAENSSSDDNRSDTEKDTR
ncbi:DUF5305 family protein [Halocatena pleomorpha]|uniref:DUF5305 domain-containing protein n=1 Tax=Halocatena pleomorpha TaxID=1785090 RepID=A0A3P3RDQ9_9EURY|nr:DUF5305 family protein [Halocatena pleomorpha]RRJ31541.1 hypothetical protein EIK79_07460 [Halocatena pleomorpha]